MDDVIETSDSSYLKPLTIDMRETKPPRVCIDSRRSNQITRPDRPRVQESLQRSHGTQFITRIDLFSVFLRIELKPESRKYTAFLFDFQVYQFKRTPCGFRNSLSAFIRVLQFALGTRFLWVHRELCQWFTGFFLNPLNFIFNTWG